METEFTPIETQEALDGIIAEHDKQFEGWKSPEQVQADSDKLYLGEINLPKLYLGRTFVKRAYRGNKIVFESGV